MITRFEDLPNELLLDLFEYISLRDLYYSFCRLNRRLNHVVGIMNNLSIILYKNERLLIEIFAHKITHLVVVSMHDVIDLDQFPHLRSLTVHRINDNQLKHIRHECMPKLIYLCISLSSITSASTEFTQKIFSNRLPSLRYVDLGEIDVPLISTWSVSPSLYSVCIYCIEPIVIRLILISCPNLKRFQVKIGRTNQRIDLLNIPLNHCLKHLILIDCKDFLSLETIDKILLWIPNLKRLFYQSYCVSPFLLVAQIFSNRLKYLTQFDCSILESINDYPNNNLENIHQIHPCFNRIQCTTKSNGDRWYTTDKDLFGS